MKRERTSPTPSAEPEPREEIPCAKQPLNGPKRSKKVHRTRKTAKDNLEKKATGGWTAESKAKLVDLIFTAGLSSIKLDDVASLTGLTKKQIADATCRGRNTLRHKIVEYAANAPATGSSRKPKTTEEE